MHIQLLKSKGSDYPIEYDTSTGKVVSAEREKAEIDLRSGELQDTMSGAVQYFIDQAWATDRFKLKNDKSGVFIEFVSKERAEENEKIYVKDLKDVMDLLKFVMDNLPSSVVFKIPDDPVLRKNILDLSKILLDKRDQYSELFKLNQELSKQNMEQTPHVATAAQKGVTFAKHVEIWTPVPTELAPESETKGLPEKSSQKESDVGKKKGRASFSGAADKVRRTLSFALPKKEKKSTEILNVDFFSLSEQKVDGRDSQILMFKGDREKYPAQLQEMGDTVTGIEYIKPNEKGEKEKHLLRLDNDKNWYEDLKDVPGCAKHFVKCYPTRTGGDSFVCMSDEGKLYKIKSITTKGDTHTITTESVRDKTEKIVKIESGIRAIEWDKNPELRAYISIPKPKSSLT